MAWFKRDKKGIHTSTEDKLEAPDGIWEKCPSCKKALHYQEQVDNLHVCQYCNHHLRIGSREYFELLFDNNDFKELFGNLTSGDPLNFTDSKKYTERLKSALDATGETDALIRPIAPFLAKHLAHDHA